MRLPDDDDIYEVDQDYLGPPGRYVGRVKYRSIAVFPVLFLLLTVVQRQVGIAPGVFSILWTVVIASYLTGEVISRTTYERPLSALLWTFWHELSAERSPTKGAASAFAARRLRLRTGSTSDKENLW